jgi:diguanylate cyclase (GGDEF)-like protein
MPSLAHKAQARILTQTLGELFNNATPTLLASSLVGAMLYLVIARYAPTGQTGTWLATLLAINLGRILWARGERQRYPDHPEQSGRGYAAGALLSGLAWGSLILLYRPEMPLTSQLLIIITLVCLPPASLPSNGVHRATFLAFSLPIMLALEAWALFLSPDLRLEFSAIGLIYSTLIIASGLRYGATLNQSIHNSEENRMLAREIKKVNARLLRFAYRDPLTNLSNRRRLDETLQHLMAQVSYAGLQLALFLIDVDDFKLVNDTFGHEAGDKLLQHIADRIQTASRQSELVVLERLETARIGGDEFVVLYQAPQADMDAEAIARRIFEAVTQPLTLNGTRYQPRISIGVALTSDAVTDGEDLMRMADRAMYQAKHAGGNRIAHAPRPRPASIARLDRA